jgi:hypothetical protein
LVANELAGVVLDRVLVAFSRPELRVSRLKSTLASLTVDRLDIVAAFALGPHLHDAERMVVAVASGALSTGTTCPSQRRIAPSPSDKFTVEGPVPLQAWRYYYSKLQSFIQVFHILLVIRYTYLRRTFLCLPACRTVRRLFRIRRPAVIATIIITITITITVTITISITSATILLLQSGVVLVPALPSDIRGLQFGREAFAEQHQDGTPLQQAQAKVGRQPIEGAQGDQGTSEHAANIVDEADLPGHGLG